MDMEFNDAFDICRANLRLALRLGSLAQEWRQHACTLQARRIERDKEALRREREALASAKDWSEFNSATQAVMRDYAAETMSLWQESMGVAISNQSAFGEAFSEVLKNWQSAWTGGFPRTAGAGKAAVPDWFPGLAFAMQPAQQAESAPAAPVRAAKGDHHAV